MSERRAGVRVLCGERDAEIVDGAQQGDQLRFVPAPRRATILARLPATLQPSRARADTPVMESPVSSREPSIRPKSVGRVVGRIAMFLLVTVGVAAVHFVVWFITFGAVLAQGLGTARWWTAFLGRVFVPLGFPATFIIGRWTPGLIELPNGVFFSLMIGTSLLWGTAIALLWNWRYLRRVRGHGAATTAPRRQAA